MTGIPTISVRGTITCWTVFSPKSKIWWSSSSSCSSIAPPCRLCTTSISNSSAECTLECSLVAWKPSNWTTAFPTLFMNAIKGRKTRANNRRGRETKNTASSGRCKAIDLGTNTPRMICPAVMIVKLMITANVCVRTSAAGPPIQANSGSIRCARDGSPIHPNARLASVMPSCVAAI